MNTKNKVLLGSAVAGILSGMLAMSGSAADAKSSHTATKAEVEKCYGLVQCKGHGQCGGKGHACAGQNNCRMEGWINVQKGWCEKAGGSLTQIEQKKG